MIKTLFSGDKLSNVQDMKYGWQEASKTAMALDLTTGSITGWQMYQIAKELIMSQELEFSLHPPVWPAIVYFVVSVAIFSCFISGN